MGCQISNGYIRLGKIVFLGPRHKVMGQGHGRRVRMLPGIPYTQISIFWSLSFQNPVPMVLFKF